MRTKGKEFRLGNDTIMLYPISFLAEALSKALESPRTTQTIRKWETKGIIPKALFRNAGVRLYSKRQIDIICRVAKECDIKQGLSLEESNFKNRVHKEIGEINKMYKKRMAK